RFPRRRGGGIILPRLRHRTFTHGWFGTLLVGYDSTGYFLAWPLVRGRGQHSHRARGRRNPHLFLFWAPRSCGKRDWARVSGFCCQRLASAFLLVADEYKNGKASAARDDRAYE